jgi:hypothetical protein
VTLVKVFVTWGVTALPLKKISSRDLQKEREHKKTMKNVLMLKKKTKYQDN